MPQSFYDFYFQQEPKEQPQPTPTPPSSFYDFYMQKEADAVLPSLEKMGQSVFGGVQQVGQQLGALGGAMMPTQQPEPGFTDLLQFQQAGYRTPPTPEVGSLAPIGEVPAMGMTGIAGFITSPIAHLVARIKGKSPEEAKLASQEWAESIAYQPKHPESAAMGGAMFAPFMQIYEPLKKTMAKTLKAPLEAYTKQEISQEDAEAAIDFLVATSPVVKKLTKQAGKAVDSAKFQKVIKQELKKTLDTEVKTLTEQLKKEMEVTPEKIAEQQAVHEQARIAREKAPPIATAETTPMPPITKKMAAALKKSLAEAELKGEKPTPPEVEITKPTTPAGAIAQKATGRLDKVLGILAEEYIKKHGIEKLKKDFPDAYKAYRIRSAEQAGKIGVEKPTEPTLPSAEPNIKYVSEPKAQLTNPKQQKQWLMKEVDKAYGKAKSVTGEEPTPRMLKWASPSAKKFGVVTFEVPGDGVFEIINERHALKRFRKRISKWPTQPLKVKRPSVPSIKRQPVSARTLEEIKWETEGRLEKLSPEQLKQQKQQLLEQRGLTKEQTIQPTIKPTVGGETAKVVADITKDIKGRVPKAGLSIEETTQRAKAKPYKFKDAEAEAGYQVGKKGAGGRGAIRGAAKLVQSMWHKISRVHEHLPRTKQFGEGHEILRQLNHQKRQQTRHALEIQQGIIEEFRKDPVRYDLMTRKALMNDLVEEVGRGQEKLPFGFTPKGVKAEAPRLDTVLAQYPEIQKAMANRKRVWKAVNNDYISIMKALGKDVESMFERKDYFRHQVLEYANAKGLVGIGKKLKTPGWRGFLQKRKGYEGIINVDYLQVETEVMSQMLYDIEVGKSLLRFRKEYDIATKVRRDAKTQGLDMWEKAIPEGQTTWQPREGNVFFMADSVPSKLVVEALAKELKQIGVPIESIKKVRAMGRPYKKWVIPEELAKTLDKVLPPEEASIVKDAASFIQRKWKRWVLLSPRRFVKYNIRNLSGDADAAFVGNPRGFLKAPRAIKELYEHLVLDKPLKGELRDWIDRGGMESTLQAQEMYDIKHNRIFRDLYKESTAGNLNVLKKYWKGVRGITDFREAILRYSNYLEYLEQMKKSPDGMPKNFGASLREEIKGVKNIKDRAFRLSNDLLGAYDEISVAGNALRRYVYPFWSWKELNFKRYTRLARNAFYDDKLAMAIGRKMTSFAIRSPYLALRVGKLGLKVSAFWATLQAWNTLRYPDIEESLPDEVKNSPHLNLGWTKEGESVYFTKLGALDDVLDTFGLDGLPHIVSDLISGKKTFDETAKRVVQSAANEFYQGISPAWKAPFELLLRQKTFPDVFNTRTIRDKWGYVMQQLNLENEYRAITEKPGKPYKKTLFNIAAYSGDPLRTAYEEVFELKREFQEQYGKAGEGFWLTPRGNALYHMKQAHRYGDKKAMKKYWEEFVGYHLQELKITGKPPEDVLDSIKNSATQSFENMSPLSGLSKSERKAFLESLDEEGRDTIVKAFKFYLEVLLAGEK